MQNSDDQPPHYNNPQHYAPPASYYPGAHPPQYQPPNQYPQSHYPQQNPPYQTENVIYQPYIPPNQPQQFHQVYHQDHPGYGHVVVPFDIQSPPQRHHDAYEEAQAKIRKLNFKLENCKFACYKFFVLIFCIFSGIGTLMYFFALFGGYDNQVFNAFMELIFSAWECYQFSLAYTGISRRHLGSAKQAVTSFKWFMVLYGVISLIMVYNSPPSDMYGDIYDPDVSDNAERDSQVVSIFLTEIVMALLLNRAIKVKKILEKMKKYQEKIMATY